MPQKIFGKIRKIWNQGICSKSYESYLSNRLQYVLLNNVNKPVKMGVPQDSVLGQLLFVICINDLQYCMSSVLKLCDDDPAVFLSADSLRNLEIHLNSELSRINTWMKKSKPTINCSNSYALVISSTLA